MKRSVLKSIVLLSLMVALFGCVKDVPDAPDTSPIPFNPDKVLTIGQLKNILTDSAGTYTFNDNYSLFATVVMDESSGNIYRSAHIEDATGGIQVNLLNPGGLYLGDSVRILLNGTTLDEYGGMPQIQNVDVGKMVMKLGTDNFVEPLLVTIEQLRTNIAFYESRVIRLEDVQFIDSELGTPFADSVNKVDKNKTLEDCNGNTIIVRTSGYANFANRTLPEGNGSLIAIAGHYNSDPQLTIRTISEVQLNDLRCDLTVELPEPNTTISNLKTLYQGQRIQIQGDLVIGATVVANDESGNYYKTIVIQDESAGIELKINDYDLYTSFPVGQEVYVKCKDLYLDTYGGVIQLGSVYDNNGTLAFGGIQPGSLYTHVVKGLNIVPLSPQEVQIPEINEDLIGSLVKLSDVQFSENELGETWADAPNLASMNRVLENCNGQTIIVRTSGYASFAGSVLPEGKGTFTAIVSAFNGTMQLFVRDLDDIDLSGERCEIGSGGTPILNTTFDEGWQSWETISKSGSQQWNRDNTWGPDGTPCAAMNGFEAGYHINNDWLISPEIDCASYFGVFLNFETAKNYDGDDLIVKVTSNYTGDPASTDWTILDPSLSEGGNNWTSSGTLNISDFSGGSLWVAFEYNSTNTSGAAWRVDNVVVKAN